MPTEATRPLAQRGAQRRARTVAGGLGLALLLLVSVGGGFWWRARVQGERLRADLMEVIWQEARINATGDTRLFTPLLDPDAPILWRVFYEELYRQGFTLPARPRMHTLELQAGGTLALVELEWPPLDDTALAEADRVTAVMVRHAYRLVGGQWRRTPWPAPSSPPVEQSSPHFTVRGPARDIAAAVSLSDLEALHEHLAQSWPPALLETRRIVVEVQPQEFANLLRDERHDMESLTVRINVPDSAPIVLEQPLAPAVQYHLRMGSLMMQRFVRTPSPLNLTPGTRAYDHIILLFALEAAEARYWTLEEGEQQAFRNGMRAQLGNEWIAPSVMVPLPNGTLAEHERWTLRREIASHLLLDWVVNEYGVEALGRMAHAMAATPPDGFDFDAVLATTTDLPAAEALQRARTYALTRE